MKVLKVLIGVLFMALTLGASPSMAASVAGGLRAAGDVAAPAKAGAVEQIRHRRFGFSFGYGGWGGGWGGYRGYYGGPFYGYGYIPRRRYYRDDYYYSQPYGYHYSYRRHRHRDWDDDWDD